MIETWVWRGGPDGGAAQRYAVPAEDNQTVLDLVAWIQENEDPALSYRFACRVGMCGSCAMVVNGKPRWTCRTHVSKAVEGGAVRIAPLTNLPVIKDLVVDMDPFFEKWIAAEGVFHPTETRQAAPAAISPAAPERQAADAGVECINCGVCHAACDTVANRPDFLGPAALNRAWTVLNDAKDGGRDAVLDAATGPGGCQSCHGIGACARFCPNGLSPMTAIAGLKRAAVKRAMGRG